MGGHFILCQDAPTVERKVCTMTDDFNAVGVTTLGASAVFSLPVVSYAELWHAVDGHVDASCLINFGEKSWACRTLVSVSQLSPL